jgi:hypothetical protein
MYEALAQLLPTNTIQYSTSWGTETPPSRLKPVLVQGLGFPELLSTSSDPSDTGRLHLP